MTEPDASALPVDPDLAQPTPVRRVRPRRRPAQLAPPRVLLAVAAGGAVGTLARYLVAVALPTGGGGFPWATFWTNVSGSLLLGFIVILVMERFPPTRYLRPLLATGFCGGYTTFSTFAVEADLLVRDGHSGMAAGYVAASVVAGLAAVVLGMVAGRVLPIPQGRARGDRPGGRR